MSTATNRAVSSSAHAEVLSALKIVGSTPAIDKKVRDAEAGRITWEFASDLIWAAIGAKARQLREEGESDG